MISAALTLFLQSAIKSPQSIGAIVPSSCSLAKAMVGQSTRKHFDEYIDLGSGTGVFAQALLDMGIPPRNITLVENQPRFQSNLTRQFPQCNVVQDDATHFLTGLSRNVSPSRFIISGLPLRLFSSEQKTRFGRAIHQAIGNKGKLVQFSYGPTNPLHQCSDFSAERAAFVFSNLPPAWVWTYVTKLQ